MNQFDMDSFIKHSLADLKAKGYEPDYKGSAYTFLKNGVKISTKLETRDHKFDDGETGPVATKLVVEVEFLPFTEENPTVIVQPHSDFEEQFATAVAQEAYEEIVSMIDHAVDESLSDLSEDLL